MECAHIYMNVCVCDVCFAFAFLLCFKEIIDTPDLIVDKQHFIFWDNCFKGDFKLNFHVSRAPPYHYKFW